MKRRGHTRGQRFVKADYYELDWYYEECTDGKNLLQYSFMQSHVVAEQLTGVVGLGMEQW